MEHTPRRFIGFWQSTLINRSKCKAGNPFLAVKNKRMAKNHLRKSVVDFSKIVFLNTEKSLLQRLQ